MVECKASRADFLRDARQAEDLVAARSRLEEAQRRLEEEILKTSDDAARRGEPGLFVGLDGWDFSKCRVGSYRGVVRELARVHEALYGQTKFQRAARYGLADRLIVAAPVGLIAPRELPRGWGLVEFDLLTIGTGREASGEEGGPQRFPPARVRLADSPASTDRHRQRLLRNIAVAAAMRLGRD
jgi:hypothetical protein